MAENITLAPVTTFTNDSSAVATVNANNQILTSAFTNVLDRYGSSPNTMQAVLDMNSFNIINLPSPATINSPARLVDVVSNPTIQVPPVGTSGSTVPLLNGLNTWSAANTSTITANVSTIAPNMTYNRTITYSGGSPFGSGDNAVLINYHTGALQTSFGFAFVSQVDNKTPFANHINSQHVAVTGTINKNLAGTSTSPGTESSDSWSGFFQSTDSSGVANPVGLLTGIEIDIGTGGGGNQPGTTDSHGNRTGLSILGRSDFTSTPSHVGSGIIVNTGQAIFDNGFQFAGNFTNAISFLNGAYTNGELIGTTWSIKNGSAAFINLNLNTGAQSAFFIGQNGNYNILSLNGQHISSSNIGLTGGATIDQSLYLQAPAGGNVFSQIGGVAYLTVAAHAVTTVPSDALGTAVNPNIVLAYTSTTGLAIFTGSGSPSGVTAAAQGSLYIRTDGTNGSGTNHLYVNTSTGSGSTWTAVA